MLCRIWEKPLASLLFCAERPTTPSSAAPSPPPPLASHSLLPGSCHPPSASSPPLYLALYPFLLICPRVHAPPPLHRTSHSALRCTHAPSTFFCSSSSLTLCPFPDHTNQRSLFPICFPTCSPTCSRTCSQDLPHLLPYLLTHLLRGPPPPAPPPAPLPAPPPAPLPALPLAPITSNFLLLLSSD